MIVNECKAKCVRIFYPETYNEKTINSTSYNFPWKKIMMYKMYYSIHFYNTLEICETNFSSTGNLSSGQH